VDPDATPYNEKRPALPAGARRLVCCGEELWLLAERALYRTGVSTLFVADTHFGKDATFRALGIPVPRGSDEETLGRLTRALLATQATRLVVLGDFFHARQGWTESTLASLSAWRERHAELEVLLVKGNHDAHAGDPPFFLRIDVVEGDVLEMPFLYTHEPRSDGRSFVFGGHIHPGVSLSLGGATVTLPCFFFTGDCVTLPSFGQFTGAVAVAAKPRAGHTVFAIAGERVMDVTLLLSNR